MQQAAVEFARNVLDFDDADTTEINAKTKHPVIDVMLDQKESLKYHKLGATQRLGAWEFKAKAATLFARSYGSLTGSERHRHRFEFNNKYKKVFEDKGMIIAATTKDGTLVEALELTDHPFFIGVQFHPELKSRFLHPHPLYMAFISAVKDYRYI